MESLIEKLPDAPGCWLWIGKLNQHGYGYTPKYKLAHRVFYEIYKGPIGDKFVLHRCDIRCCVNPEHLFLGTQRDNMKDMNIKGRRNDNRNTKGIYKEYCRRGHKRDLANLGSHSHCLECRKISRKRYYLNSGR